MPPAGFEGVQATLAKNVSARLKRRKQTIRAFAELAGVSPAMMHAVLAGTANPSLAWITTVADELEVDVYELLKPTTR